VGFARLMGDLEQSLGRLHDRRGEPRPADKDTR
jgi:hypothetical protein